MNLVQPRDYGFIIPRRFIHWKNLPIELQSKILSFYKFSCSDLLQFLMVSKSFKAIVEQLHTDIYNISLGFCTKECWIRKSYIPFRILVKNLQRNTGIEFPDIEIRKLYCQTSMFRICLHLFLCKRSCDKTDNYCWICSCVRDRNFEMRNTFDDVFFERCHDIDKLGLTDITIDFDVYVSRWGNSFPKRDSKKLCMWADIIFSGSDVFKPFVSILLRVNLNLYYNYFLSFQMSLENERITIRRIQMFVLDICHAFWTCNINYFFAIFDKFKSLNRSVCYDVYQDKPLKGPYDHKKPVAARFFYYDDDYTEYDLMNDL